MKKFLFIATFLASWLSFSPMYAQNVAQIGSTEYATLQEAINEAPAGQTITLLTDVDATSYFTSSTDRMPISKSMTIDGNGHTVTVAGRGFGVGMNASSNIDVTFQNITIQNSGSGARCIDTRGNIGTLTLSGLTLKTDGGSGYTQPLTIGGNQTSTATVNITNSTIQTNNDGTAYYAIITFNPVNMTISGSTIKGWACIYAKKADNSCAGSAGSVFTIKDSSTLVSSNAYSGVSNSFSAIMMEDNNVTIKMTNSTATINNTGDQQQALIGYSSTSITGNIELGGGNNINFAGPNDCELIRNGASSTLSLTGGTFNFDPTPYLAEGYVLINNGDGTYGVKAAYVAQIGTTKYETLAAAVAAVPADGTATTITMIADEIINVNLGPNVAANQNIVLDLNGFTISQTAPDASVSYLIQNNGTLKIKDSSDVNEDGTGTGKMYSEATQPSSSNAYATNLISNRGQLTIESGYLESHSRYASYVVDNYTNGNLTVNGGHLYNYFTSAIRLFCNSTTAENNVTINGGIIEGYCTIWVQSPNNNANKGNLTINGGTFKTTEKAVVNGTTPIAEGNSYLYMYPSNENMSITIAGGTFDTNIATWGNGGITISGGTFNGYVYSANQTNFISGGTFAEPVPEAYCAAGYIPTNLGNGKYGVKEGSYVAQVGTTKYETLQAAIDAATAGATIDILADFDLTTVSTTVNGNASDKYNVVVGKNLTINGNGHAITASTGKRAIAVEGTANLTINNLTVNGNKATGVVWMLSTGTLTLDNGTVLDGTSYNEYNQVLTIGSGLTSKPTINVNNSTIKTNNEGSAHYDIILWSPANVNITNSTMLGWAAIYVKPAAAGSNVSVSNSTITSKGYSGNSNDFGIFSSESDGNTFTLDGNTYNITAQTGTYNTLININGASNNTVNITNTTAYNTNDTNYGGIIRVGDIDSNAINLDATSAQTLQDEIQVLVDAGATTETSNGITTLSFVAEVYYYWIASGVEEGEKCTFAEPFTNGWLANGEFIRLQKDVTLSANVACQLTSGSFTLTQGAFAITKGEYAVTLKNGVSVVTDKQTDIFAAADAANYTISETEDNGTYTYTVVEKTFVAQIGDTKYESLAEAVAAVPAGTETTITMIANETIDVVGYAITIPAGKNVVLDLSGHQVAGTCSTGATSALIYNKGTLTIQDSSAEGTGELTYDADPYWVYSEADPSGYASDLIKNEGTLVVNSGSLYNQGTGSATYAIDNFTAGSVTINGGTVDAAKASAIRLFYNNGGSVTVSGGVIGHYNSDDDYAYMGIQVQNGTNANVTVTGGTIAGYYAFYANNTGGEITISGGTFKGYTGYVGQYLPKGYMLADNGDGTYGVTSEGVEIYYSWIQNNVMVGESLPFATPFVNEYLMDGEFIELLKNVTLTENIACQLEPAEGATTASFTMTFGEYTVTKGDYSVSLKAGVSVHTDKQTDIFTAEDNTYKVVGTQTADGYTYTLVVKPMDEQDIELVDGQPYTFTQDTEVASATYVRTLGENLTNVYLPWYVPFDYTITSEDAENLTFYRINMIANSPQQGEVQETDKVWIFVTPMAVGDKLTANRPYLFKSKAAETFTFTTTGATLYAPATDARLENSTSVYKYEFYGTYGPTQLAANSYNYYMTSKGQITYPGDSPINLKPYRWYIKATAKANGGAYAPAFVFIEDEDDDATGIKLEGNTQAGESYYNLNGMRINKPTSGAYIIKYSDGSSKKIIK